MNSKNDIGVFIESDENIIKKYKHILECSFITTIFSDINTALPYIIEHNTEILFCIIRWSSNYENKLTTFIEKIHTINPLLKIFLIETVSSFSSLYSDMIKKYAVIDIPKDKTSEAVLDIITKNIIQANTPRRMYSRVNWPLNVTVANMIDKTKQKLERHILSISGNGAYVCSDTDIPAKDEMLVLTISFKDFKLFTEAKVVWTNDKNQKPDYPAGFAVVFKDIGVASQRIIDNIIKDKLLKDILVEYKDE